MLKFISSIFLSLMLVLVAWAGVSTNIQYDGEIEETQMVEGTIAGKKVKIAVVNGFLPNEILEGNDKGKEVSYRNFVFNKKTPYKKGQKVEYEFGKKGIGITESVTDKDGKETITNEYVTNIYKLKE
jgi:hypothetical protein